MSFADFTKYLFELAAIRVDFLRFVKRRPFLQSQKGLHDVLFFAVWIVAFQLKIVNAIRVQERLVLQSQVTVFRQVSLRQKFIKGTSGILTNCQQPLLPVENL